MSRVRPHSLVPAVAAVVLAFITRPAAAQGWDQILQPRISAADVRRMLDGLPIDEQQALAALALFNVFAADYARAADECRQRIKHIERGEGRDDWSALNYDWWDKRLELETRLEHDFLAVMTTDQQRAAATRTFADERRRYVLHELRTDQGQKQQIDPLDALQDVALTADERERIAPAIDAYVLSMDQALQHWQREHIRIGREINADKGNDDAWRARRVAAITLWADTAAAIIRVSERAVAPIAAGLDPEHRTAFLLGIDKLNYPQAFERCPAEIAVESLKMTPDIAPEKRAAIDVIYADYAPKRDQIRAQIIEIVRKWERGDYPAKREIEQLRPAADRGEITRDERFRRNHELATQHPANPLLEKRHDLAIETVHRMRGVFSEDEIAHMPLAAQIALTAW